MPKKNARLSRINKKIKARLSPYLKKRIIAVAAACFLALSAGAAYAIFSTVSRDLPQITSLKNYKPPLGTQIFSEDDHLIGRLKVDKGIFVPLSQIPESLRKAVVAVEDARFYEHGGLDYQGIVRAVLKDMLSISFKEGGSTITQQLAKVIFLTPEKSLSRKVREALLARKIERTLTKDEILELYLNKIYFGHGAYGAEMAARTYFGKHVGDVTLGESAMIAGLIRSPMGYSPYNNMEQARNREATVLHRMVDEKLVSQGQADTALAQPLTLKNLRAREEAAPHLVEQIRQYVEKKYGPDKVYIEGLSVRTTINYQLQLAAVKAVEEGVRAVDKRIGFRGPLGKRSKKELAKMMDDPYAKADTFGPGEVVTGTVLQVSETGAYVSARGSRGYIPFKEIQWAGGKDAAKKKAYDILSPGYIVQLRVKGFDNKTKLLQFTLEQDAAVQGALVAMDPWEGKVKALVGGPDFQRNEFNHAALAHRQPGSAFKPLVYAAAIEAGYTPASIINDEPRSYDDDTWKPRNFDGEFHGPTRLREALVHSRNVVTIDLLHQISVGRVLDLAEKLGMSGPFERNLTLALGSGSVTPVELTAAYCSFANGGYSVVPVTVLQITDARGTVLETNETHVEPVFSSETAYQVTSILEDAVRRGTGQLALSLGKVVAGKTGTTNDYKDAWFVGYTPAIVAGVWVGNDDQRPMARGESGSRAALPIWVRFMSTAVNVCPAEDFPMPDDIEPAVIDADTGLLATGKSREVLTEYFKKGTAPKEYAPAPKEAVPAAPAAEGEKAPEEKKKRQLQDVD